MVPYDILYFFPSSMRTIFFETFLRLYDSLGVLIDIGSKIHTFIIIRFVQYRRSVAISHDLHVESMSAYARRADSKF